MRRRPSCLRAIFCVFSAFSLFSRPVWAAGPPPTPAPPRPTPQPASLGGPVVPLAQTSSVANTRPNSDNPPGGDTPVIPGVTYSGATEDRDPGQMQPPAALGPAPFPLENILRLQVGSVSVSETPLRVGNLDILAPIADQLPLLGSTVTRADPKNVPGAFDGPTEEKNFQVNLPNGTPIVFTVGKASAWVNSNEQPLRAAPLVIKNQIWLPVFSLAPLLGAAARLDTKGTLVLTPTVQSVELFPVAGRVAITVQTSAPLDPGSTKIGVLSNPDRLYIDFPGFSMGFDAGNSTVMRLVSAGMGDVEGVRAGMPPTVPNTTRVTLNLKRAFMGAPQEMPDKTLFAMVLVEPGGAPPAPIPTGNPVPSNGSLRGMTIVVDAGHGGHDTGARGAISDEKNHTLDIAKKLAFFLEKRGATVLMTRYDDYFVTLQGRVDFANARRADLFVSVHINASVNKNSTGTETFYFSAISQSLAREVHKELSKATGRPNRGISQARFYVIRKTWMPSILTETAFITNPGEESLLVDPKFREKVAAGIAQGIANYVAIYGRGVAG